MTTTKETFFRPDELARERTTIPASLFNRCRLLRARCQLAQAFVPIRSMQYQAVIDLQEIIFVDNHAYAVRDGTGGRLIVLSWQFGRAGSRDSLNEPVAIDLVGYQPELRRLHQRVMSEFPLALLDMERRMRASSPDCSDRTVIGFPS